MAVVAGVYEPRGASSLLLELVAGNTSTQVIFQYTNVIYHTDAVLHLH